MKTNFFENFLKNYDFLFKKVVGYRVFRVVFFLPSIISAVVYVTVFKNFVQTFGPLYTILDAAFNYKLPPLLSNND